MARVKLTVDPGQPRKLYSAGHCPVCADRGLLYLAVTGADRFVVFCPMCGVAWPEPPPPYRVDTILALEELAPDGVTLPTESQARDSPYHLEEVAFEEWFSLLEAELLK